MRVGNSPEARLGEQISAALYLNHPYGRPVIGWRPEIEQLNREDALAFYRRFYGPNNAVVVIAGDVDPDDVKALAEKSYGAIPKGADTETRSRPREPTPVAVRKVMMDDPRLAQPSVYRSYLVPSYATAKREEAEGGGSNSRLYRRLVVDKRLATNAGTAYQAVDPTWLSGSTLRRSPASPCPISRTRSTRSLPRSSPMESRRRSWSAPRRA